MNSAVIAKNPGKPRILVAPLDWGLGHATRCIPIIRELLDQGCEPWLAGEGAQESLLRQEFPELPFLSLQGYRARYGRSAAGLLGRMLVQAPKFLLAIRKERAWLRRVLKEYDFDAVISDNRFGLSQAGIPCVFITHQLAIQVPQAKWAASLLQKLNYRFINRFTECWVPDQQSEPSLAGILSHPTAMPPVPTHYLGPLSRFRNTSSQPQAGRLLILLSGPEPQRTIFENMLISQVVHYPHTACIVRGVPGSASLLPSTNMLRFYNHLPAAELQRELTEAEFVIARSGYSTIMDLAIMRRESILVATPGQTEQEYLARYLRGQHFAYTCTQKEFKLEEALRNARNFSFRFPPLQHKEGLHEVITGFLARHFGAERS